MDRMLRDTISAATLRVTSSFSSGGTLADIGGLCLPIFIFRVRCFEVAGSDGDGGMTTDSARGGAGIAGARSESIRFTVSFRSNRESRPTNGARWDRRAGEEGRKGHLASLAWVDNSAGVSVESTCKFTNTHDSCRRDSRRQNGKKRARGRKVFMAAAAGYFHSYLRHPPLSP